MLQRSLISLGLLCACDNALADSLPSSADISRLKPPPSLDAKPYSTSPSSSSENNKVSTDIPKEAYNIKLQISRVHITGNHAVSTEELRSLYNSAIGTHGTLATIYEIADKITNYYRTKGYILSKAYIPAQSIANGNIEIGVVEGYIGQVTLDKNLQGNRIAQTITDKLKNTRPVTLKALETAILQLNDLPGIKAEQVLHKLDVAKDGEAGVTFTSVPSPMGKGAYVSNNYGSRFIGPYQHSLLYENAFFQNQKTQFAFLGTMPAEELKYGSVEHTIHIDEKNRISFLFNSVKAKPGGSLQAQNIKSSTMETSATLHHQYIRAKDKNLSAYAKLGHKTLNTYTLSTVSLTHDSIYSAQLGVDASVEDALNGTNTISIIATQGLDIFDASHAGELFLSREDAKPTFRKIELEYQRSQFLSSNYLLSNKINAQWGDNHLFSSEEFGYGGQDFGRSFDASAFSGKSGINASVDVSYYGLNEKFALPTIPYTFYDIGYSKNTQSENESIVASSAGIGTKLQIKPSATADFTLAWPLFEDIPNPHYASNRAPRFLAQLTYNF